MRDILHFSHANSFPATCYRKMFGELEAHYQVGYIERLGHNPDYPVTDSWPHLVAETLDYIRQHYDRPVIGVGHSLGGYLTLMAALAAPELFKAIVVMDSPLMGAWRGRGLWLAKRLKVVDRLTPGRYTLRRRDAWPSVESAYSFFANKPLFARFDPDVLWDYAQSGTEDCEVGRRLRFRPHIEHQIYRSMPHGLHRYHGKLAVPGAYFVGAETDLVGPAERLNAHRHFGLTVHTVSGSHLFPLEHPQLTAATLLKVLPTLLEHSGQKKRHSSD